MELLTPGPLGGGSRLFTVGVGESRALHFQKLKARVFIATIIIAYQFLFKDKQDAVLDGTNDFFIRALGGHGDDEGTFSRCRWTVIGTGAIHIVVFQSPPASSQ